MIVKTNDYWYQKGFTDGADATAIQMEEIKGSIKGGGGRGCSPDDFQTKGQRAKKWFDLGYKWGMQDSETVLKARIIEKVNKVRGGFYTKKYFIKIIKEA